MWRDGEGKRGVTPKITRFRADSTPFLKAGARNGPRTRSRAPQAASGLRDDRCTLERRHHHVRRRRMALAGAFKQHPPLEGGGTHHRIALENLVAQSRK